VRQKRIQDDLIQCGARLRLRDQGLELFPRTDTFRDVLNRADQDRRVTVVALDYLAMTIPMAIAPILAANPVARSEASAMRGLLHQTPGLLGVVGVNLLEPLIAFARKLTSVVAQRAVDVPMPGDHAGLDIRLGQNIV